VLPLAPEQIRRFGELLDPVLRVLRIELTAEQIALLARHYYLLERWNRRINLTRVSTPREIVERHFGESLFVARFVDEGASAADIGSGAGFPGLPVAVARPDLQVTLVESVGKKATFLKECTRGIPNLRVFHGRSEQFEQSVDWVLLRAVRAGGQLASMGRKARRAGVLSSRSTLEELREAPGVAWEAPVPMPWGRDRVLMLGAFHVER